MDSSRGQLPAPVVTHLQPEYERLTEDELRSLQLRLFRDDVERVRRDNRFYAELYAQARVGDVAIRDLGDVRKIPVVRKSTILADAAMEPPFGARLQVPHSEIVEVVESSGTSGLGRETQALTASDREFVLEAKQFQFYWVGCRKATVVALHIPVTMAAGALWSLQALQRLESNVLRLGNLDADARVNHMKRYGVEVTAASTSYLMRLEYAAESAGMDLQGDFPSLRSIYVGSGGWTIAWAEERAARWNARLFEVYGSSQRAFAITCEWGILRGRQPGVLHFLPHLGLTEVIDPDTGEHVKPGEVGEIVVTPFNQRASPLIRYATGDRARFVGSGSCPCGRAFAGIEAGSVGRYDDMLRLKELNVWPTTVDSIILGEPWVGEYRGDVFLDTEAREVTRIMVEFRPDVSADSRASLLGRLADELHARIGIHFRCEEWSGPSLLGEEGQGMSPDSLKIKRWTDRRESSMVGSRRST